MGACQSNEEKFLSLCKVSNDATAVRKQLEKHPELVAARDTRAYLERYTPLHYAAFQGHEEVARVLVEYGGEVNAQDARGETPLHIACRNGHEAVVRLLLESAAARSVENDGGQTARDLAVRRNELHVAALLDADEEADNDED